MVWCGYDGRDGKVNSNIFGILLGVTNSRLRGSLPLAGVVRPLSASRQWVASQGVSTIEVVDGYPANINTDLYTLKMVVYTRVYISICFNDIEWSHYEGDNDICGHKL